MDVGIYWLPCDSWASDAKRWIVEQPKNCERGMGAPGNRTLGDLSKSRYRYLWWRIFYPYKGKTVRALCRGQYRTLVMVIADLDLVFATYVRNYSDAVLYRIREELVPRYVPPAIDAQN